jgi:DNA-binding beta-propeller fold protein YncE
VAAADFGVGPVAYVPCFATGQVYAIDVDRAETLAIMESGRGPNGIVASATRRRAYVANYAEDTISVIDATPGVETEHHVVVRLGKRREAN